MKIKDILNNIRPSLLNRTNVPEIPTGIDQLDDLIWGFKRGQTVIIAGRTSMGKSAFALQLAYNIVATEQFKVAVFSLEMGKEEIAERFLSLATETNNEDIMKGQMKPEDKNKVDHYIDAMNDFKLYIHDDKGFQWEQVEEYIKTEKPDVLFVDFVQMIPPDVRQTEREAYSEYIRKSIVMAQTFNCCIVLCSQINRQPEQGVKVPGVPKLSDLKGSGSLEENAHKVIICHWWWKYKDVKEDEEPYSKYDYCLYVAKNRNGRTGLITVRFEPEYYKFRG